MRFVYLKMFSLVVMHVYNASGQVFILIPSALTSPPFSATFPDFIWFALSLLFFLIHAESILYACVWDHLQAWSMDSLSGPAPLREMDSLPISSCLCQ